ncbi:MAG: hypothetical protein QGD89_07320, partial [Actinomycetota bacterium]|nr:hypothetical protein [Actinomycetota bacterium]
MRLATIAFATMMLLGPAPWLATAAAQGVLSPDDACIGVIHSPAEPVGSAPSKAIVGIALSPDYAGGDFVFHLTGASGDQTGTGTVGPDGLAFAEAPLFQYGVHQITDATVTTADGPMAVDVASIGDGGSFVVDDAEPLCDSTVLTAVPPTT